MKKDAYIYTIFIGTLTALFGKIQALPLFPYKVPIYIALNTTQETKKLLAHDQEAYDYCKEHPQSFIAIVWPIAQGKDDEIQKIFGNYGKIIYRKKTFLNYKSARTLLKSAHPFINDMDKHVDWYFPAGTFEKPARIFVLEFKNTETAVSCKLAIRHMFKNLQYRSIHINDTHNETIDLARFFFK